MRKTILVAGLLLALALPCTGQRFGVGTNAVDWLSFATLNAEASIAVSQNYSVHVGTELNPWTWRAGDPEKQLQMRQNSYWGGLRFWPWHVYSGWWAGADFRYSVYNIGGILRRDTEEGNAYGAGLYGGYAIMLTENWNLDLGIGAWGGWKQYVRYSCPLCGVITDQGGKVFVLPDARIAIQLIF